MLVTAWLFFCYNGGKLGVQKYSSRGIVSQSAYKKIHVPADTLEIRSGNVPARMERSAVMDRRFPGRFSTASTCMSL